MSGNGKDIENLRDTFSYSTDNPFYMGLSQSAAPAADTATPTVPDFTDQSFIADAAQATPEVAASGAQGPDVALSQQPERTMDNYMQANAEIKSIVVNAMNEVLGPEEGDRFAEHVFSGGAPTKVQAAATMLDPTGVAGSIYSVLNAVAAQADRYGNQETLEILDRVLNQLQQSNNPQIQNALNNRNYFPAPEGYNFDGITAKELLDFLERNPHQDPIMRQLQQSLDTIDGIRENAAYNQEHAYEFAEIRYIEGDETALDDMEVHQAEALERYSAYAVEITCESMQAPGGVTCTDPQFASTPEIQAALAGIGTQGNPSYDQEAALRQAADSFGLETAGAR